MLRRSVHAATLLGFAAALSAQSGRTMTLTAPPRLGTTMVITVNHPANAAGNYFEALFSLPTPVELDLGLPFVVGLFRLDLSAFQTFVNGMFDSGTSTTLSIPVPNATNLIGGAFDLQTIDVDLSGPTLYLADNDLELRPFAGIGKVQLIRASNRSPVSGDNDVQLVDDATVGAPVSQGMPGFAFQTIQPRGQEGYVEGYGGPFTGLPHNSDVEAFAVRRVAKRTANPAYQVVALPNGYDVGFVRHASNRRHFSVWTFHRETGAAAIVPNSTVIDTGPLNEAISNFMPHAAFSSDGEWGAVIVRDTNPAVADRVLVFRTDGSAPAIDVTPTSPASTRFFDGSALFTADFLLVAGTGGWYWTSATAPATLAPLTVPNTTASNAPNRWVYPLSWRVSRDGSSAWFPIGSHPTDPRGEMDVVRVVANNGAPQVDNVTRFAAPTSIAEFGYSAVTPDTALDSSFGIKAALSPDGTRIAFLGMGGAGVYVTSSAPDPAPVTVAGASYYSELTFLNAGTVLFFAGPDENAQDLYALDTTTMLATQVTFLGDIRTRGQFWSNNRRFWYFIRSNAASTVNNFVAVDANAASVTLRDVTGSEFSAGTAPSLRTGALNVTTDPWPALEFQLRFVPHTGLAVFAARRTVEPPTDYEDANVFVFDVENGGEATMLTANTGRGADYVVRNIESLVPCGDPPFVAWAERAGNTVATSEDVFTVSLLGGVVRRVSVPDPNGQTIVDGSIRFTSLPAAGVVWAVGQGAALDVPDQNVRVEWSALGTAAPPVRLTPSPVADRVFQVLGTTN